MPQPDLEAAQFFFFWGGGGGSWGGQGDSLYLSCDEPRSDQGCQVWPFRGQK